jgi:transcriptional regulator with XRE-family HTH domain
MHIVFFSNMTESAPKKKFFEIFASLLDRRGVKLNQVSKNTGVPEVTLFRYLKGLSADPSASILVPLSRYFQVTVDYLLGLEESMARPQIATEQFVCDPSALRRIPVISWEQIKDWGYNGPAMLPPDHVDWVYYEGEADLNTFALMIGNFAYKYTFPRNSVVIVEPKANYRPDDFVVACINRGKCSIKQVSEENGELYLNSLATSLDSVPLSTPNYVYGKIVRTVLDYKEAPINVVVYR